MIESVIVIFFLVLGSIWDVKKKSVPYMYLLLWGIVALVYLISNSLIKKNGDIWITMLFGIIPGIICLLISYVSREQIGYGDGWAILLMGALLGISRIMKLLLTAFSLLTVIAIVLLITKKAKRKSTIPFIPFLFLGYLMVFLYGRFV